MCIIKELTVKRIEMLHQAPIDCEEWLLTKRYLQMGAISQDIHSSGSGARSVNKKTHRLKLQKDKCEHL